MSGGIAKRAWIPALALVLAVPAWASGELEARLEKSSVRAGEPLRLRSSQSGDTAPVQPAPPFRVEMTVDDPEPYVHGSVRLDVRLLAAESFLEGGLSDPQVDGALLRRIGGDRQSEREIDGRRYRVVEREYALAPERSGTLRIDPVVFEALQPDPDAGRRSARGRGSLIDRFFGGSVADLLGDPFFADPFSGSLLSRLGGATRPVRVASAPLELHVKPRPASADGSWWLPAREVELSDRWEPDPPVFRVGEPVRRHVVLRARGVAADQLPPLRLPEPAGMSQYAEPAREDTRVEEGALHAQQSVDSVLIPTRPGRLELPAIEVSWWDVGADRARTARLPSRSIQVLPGAAATADTAPARPPTPGAEVGVPPAQGMAWIVPASAAALLLGALGGAGLALRPRRKVGELPVPSRRPAERALARACRRRDAAAASAACRQLAAAAAVRSLAEDASRRGEAALAAALRDLDRVRYAPEGSTAGGWEGRTLWRAWRRARRRSRRGCGTAEPVLPALYPEP